MYSEPSGFQASGFACEGDPLISVSGEAGSDDNGGGCRRTRDGRKDRWELRWGTCKFAGTLAQNTANPVQSAGTLASSLGAMQVPMDACVHIALLYCSGTDDLQT